MSPIHFFIQTVQEVCSNFLTINCNFDDIICLFCEYCLHVLLIIISLFFLFENHAKFLSFSLLFINDFSPIRNLYIIIILYSDRLEYCGSVFHKIFGFNLKLTFQLSGFNLRLRHQLAISAVPLNHLTI